MFILPGFDRTKEYTPSPSSWTWTVLLGVRLRGTNARYLLLSKLSTSPASARPSAGFSAGSRSFARRRTFMFPMARRSVLATSVSISPSGTTVSTNPKLCAS